MFPHHIRLKPPPEPEAPPPRGPGPFGWFLRAIGYLLIFVAIIAGGIALGPGVPDRLNPMAPLDPLAAPSWLTRYKLDQAVRTPQMCLAALERTGDARFARLGDREVSDTCHIRRHTLLSGLSDAGLSPVSTRCATALRLYMWERHSLQPAARQILGSGIREIDHLSSFSCRPIRTTGGEGESMSAHATASAIDISGVVLDNGRRLTLIEEWDGRTATFWRAARDGACRWFPTVLSPDFNRLHADHFHLGDERRGVCR